MSLLMEALRKAEQAKKQAAGASVAEAGKSPGAQNEQQVSPELHLSLERQDPPNVTSLGRSPAIAVDSSDTVANDQGGNRQICQARPNENGNIERAETDAGGQQSVLMAEEEVAVVDACAPSDLNDTPEREAGMALEPELSVETPVTDGAALPFADVEKPGPDIEPERDIPDVSAIHPAIASVESSRETARTVFAAKKEYQRRSRNRRLLIVGIVGGVALFAMAGFFYFAYRSTMTSASSSVAVGKNISQQDSGGVALSEARQESVPAAEGGAALSSSGVETGKIEAEVADKDAGLVSKNLLSAPADISTSQGALDLSSPHDAALLPGTASSTAATLASPTLQMNQTEPALSRDGEETRLLSDSAGEPESPSVEPIIITHRAAQPQVSSLLAAAYGAYQKGDFEQARQDYQQVLQAAPQHRGALLGLADIAMHWSEKSLARDLYLRVLDQDPGDPLARAGLLAIAPMGDLVQQESELKLLLELHPDIAQLSFSLGNVYAAGQRWSEAQQAYFNALQMAKNIVSGSRFSSIRGASDTGPSMASVSPDYPFNLAVSLEHLGQLRPAVKYYQEALQLAGDGTVGFDVDGLRARLKILEQGERP